MRDRTTPLPTPSDRNLDPPLWEHVCPRNKDSRGEPLTVLLTGGACPICGKRRPS